MESGAPQRLMGGHLCNALANQSIHQKACVSFNSQACQPNVTETLFLFLQKRSSIGFDFPFLLCETIRHSLSTTPFEDWLYVDTLHISKCLLPHGCNKLQCISLRARIDTGRAHRALDLLHEFPLASCVSVDEIMFRRQQILIGRLSCAAARR